MRHLYPLAKPRFVLPFFFLLCFVVHRAWDAKRRAEESIERSLEAIGLIDEQPGLAVGRSDESLFR